MKLFDDPLHDEFAGWPIGTLGPDGGAVGEVAAIAAALTAPDDDEFVAAWIAAADRHVAEAEQAENAGRAVHAQGNIFERRRSTKWPCTCSTARQSTSG